MISVTITLMAVIAIVVKINLFRGSLSVSGYE